MKRQKTKKVNGLLIFSICLLILAIATPITLSFFTAQKSGTKEITFGKIELESGVTQVNLTDESIIAGSDIILNDVIIAKDIFSEDMIVRVSAPYAVSTTPTNNNFNVNGVNGELTLLQLLYGGEFICEAGDGTNLYFVTYGNDTEGYTNAHGKLTSNNPTGRSYYVLADNVDRGNDSIYKATKMSGTVTVSATESENTYTITGTETVITSIIDSYNDGTATISGVTRTGESPSYVYTKNGITITGAQETNPSDFETTTTYFKLVNGNLVETNINGVATGDVNTVTPVVGTIKTARMGSIKVVDGSGNIYDQYINFALSQGNIDERNSTYTLVATGETAPTGYARGYRWLYHNGYFYLASWLGNSNVADDYNNPSATISVESALSDATFKNITKSAILRNQYVTVNNFVIADAQEDTPGRLDLYTKAGRDALLAYFYDAKIFVVSGATVTISETANDNYSSLNELLSAVNTMKANGNDYTDDLDIYLQAVDQLAVKLASVQELFYFLGATKLPNDLSQAAEYAQGGKEFTVNVTFKAIQSAYLSVPDTNIYAVDDGITGHIHGKISQFFAQNGDLLITDWA